MIHVFIAFLDSCNGILFGLPNKAVDKLQYVQDSAARVLTRTKPWTDITITLLFFLRVQPALVSSRVQHQPQTALRAYKAHHDLAPQYLSILLNDC